jgi:hypothetical protein
MITIEDSGGRGSESLVDVNVLFQFLNFVFQNLRLTIITFYCVSCQSVEALSAVNINVRKKIRLRCRKK